MGESRPPAITKRFRVAGMSTDACVTRVERALLSVPGVENALVDIDRADAAVRMDPRTRESELAGAVDDAGYTLIVASIGDDQPLPEPTPQPQPAQPLSAPEPMAPPELIEREAAEGWRAWLPEWSTVWHYASRGTVYLFAVSIFFTLLYRFVPVPFTLLMVGEAVFEGRDVRRQWVPIERISPNLIRAVIASEDNEFCHHWGFDFKELEAAWKRSQRNGGRLRGASTISQQTAKNVFLWSGRSWLRKGFEAYFTVAIETLWPKRRIMEVYLNVIEWGPGIFGAEAAARHWFHKPAARLTPLEAARLAAILPNPKRYKANPPGPYVNGRGYTIAARAYSVDLNGDDRCAKP